MSERGVEVRGTTAIYNDVGYDDIDDDRATRD